MSRKPTQKKRVRRPVVRETRSIAKDNSVIGFLSFVGVFLFLVLMGLLFFDNKKTNTDYDESDVHNFVENTNPKASKQNSGNKVTDNSGNKVTDNSEDKIVKNSSQNDQDSENENNDNKIASTEDKEEQEGLEGLPQVKNNPQIEKKDLSPDAIYRNRYDLARRSGKISDLLELAKWCEEKDMMGRTEDIYHYIIKVSPDNLTAREALGYIRTGSTWTLEKDAERAGYYKYEGKWVSAELLNKKGLYLYDGDWITLDEGKKQGLILSKGELVNKEELLALKEAEKKQKEEEEERAKKQVTQGSPEQEQVSTDKTAVLGYRHIKIYSPPKGKWSTSRSGRTTQTVFTNPIVNRNSQGSGLIDTLSDEESGIVLNVQGFSPEILYTFPDGSAAQGSEIPNLMDVFRGDAFNKYDDIQFQNVKRSRYAGETITQQLGVGKLENKPYGVLFSFFRYETLTYAITITYPMENYDKGMENKIVYLFSSMRRVKQGRY